MPFKTARQRRFMHARHSRIAQRWEHEAKRRSAKIMKTGKGRKT